MTDHTLGRTGYNTIDMANNCINHIEFSGIEENLKALALEIEAMMVYSKESGRGVLPPGYVNTNEPYWFDLFMDSTEYVLFETKWVEAVDSVLYLAKKHGVSMRHNFDEPLNELSGVQLYNHTTGGRCVIYYDDESDEVRSAQKESIDKIINKLKTN